MSPRPTLVFVPGAWHGASTWEKVSSLLEEQSYKCVKVSLPSTSSNAATFGDDVKAVQAAVVAETTEGHDVVVVVHSYGGQVGNSAVKGLTRKDDSSLAKGPSTGHIIGIAMMATGFTATGVSFLEGLGGTPPPFWKIDLESGFAVLTVDPRPLFYHDLAEEEGNFWVSKLEKQSLKSLLEGGEYAYAGWKDVPVWYLATVDDQGLPIAIQRMFVQMAKDAGADVTLREVESSHSPMLSKPKETVEYLLEAVAAMVG
ncbi:Alpha/beta hydrolase fold-1 [Amylocarpus encephaloides]|uniref:Alpha/beta hydrolase fold-1 n=1 Tax=Amylocarpus encephaloides TaxID=45428 RepID=A0A9P7YSZ8_9HELO|nr:Alpha/beta hydrolase fold-1 [Amylocarpus encephaloides]